MHFGPLTPTVPLPSFFPPATQPPPAATHDVIIIDNTAPTAPDTVRVRIEDEQIPFVQHNLNADVTDWDSYIGQDDVKAELAVMIADALERMDTLPHTLLASGLPGVGKTTLARLIAIAMYARLVPMVPPFSRDTLNQALLSLNDFDILFIDEIHKLADNGPAMAENLLTAMEEGAIYLEDGRHELAQFTLIGATTDAGRLPRAIRSRFMIKPYFERYTHAELAEIVRTNFEPKLEVALEPELRAAIAQACRYTPRVARELVIAARALTNTFRRPITPSELLSFKGVEPDGTTKAHIKYVATLFKIGRNVKADGEVEYRAGEATMLMALDEDRDGLAEIERWLIEIGLVDKTPRGRRLTPKGVTMAQHWLARGERLPK